MTEHLWDVDIEKQSDEIKNDSSETFYNPASATTSASEEIGNDTSPRPRRLKLIVAVFTFILFLGIVVAIASWFPNSYGVGDDPLTTDDMMVEFVPLDSRNKASLPRRGYLPDKDFHYKPDFPPRVRSSSPRKPRQSPDEKMKHAFNNFEDVEIATTSSSSEDQD
ncbi:hypothetical protein ACHAWC_009351 [Mediolabrus comicus]